MNSAEIFALALGLKEPWEIIDIDISVDKDSIKELNIQLGFKRGAKFDDEAGVSCSVHDTQKRSWRHLNFFEHSCHLHCAVPRIRTSDGKVRLVQLPWARSGSGFTLLFEALAMALIEREMPVNKIGQLLGENAHRIWTIFNHWIGLAYQADDPTGVTQLGFDETVKAHLSGIINYVETHITNTSLESINNKIQMAKRRARGYRNTDNFINMIYFLCGKLTFNYPLYSS